MRAEIGMRHSNCEKGLPYEVDSQGIHGNDGLGKGRHLNDGITMDRKDWFQTTSSRGIQSEEAVNPSRKAITCKAFDIARLLHSGIFLSMAFHPKSWATWDTLQTSIQKLLLFF